MDYEDEVNARFSRHRRRERLRTRNPSGGGGSMDAPPSSASNTGGTNSHRSDADGSIVSYNVEMVNHPPHTNPPEPHPEDQIRRERILQEAELRHRAQQHRRRQRRQRLRRIRRGPRLLVDTPIPIVNFRTNSDFPASALPASQWMTMAQPPVEFGEAEYSECARVGMGQSVLVPCGDDRSAADGRPTVVFNGGRYTVETAEDVIVPLGIPSSSEQRGYWLQEKIYDAIYGQVRYGTILHKLHTPLQVMLHPSDAPSEVPEGEWASVEWVAADPAKEGISSVAVKEMSWDHIRRQRMELAEDPIKEVAAMQYLQNWLEDEEEEWEMQRQQERQHRKNLKQFFNDPSGGEEEEEEEEEELPQMSAMEQSHILMPMDLLSDDYNLYSITPWCTGGRLLDMVESKNRFSEPEARYWMRQILKGLSCLKEAGVCHRDMSPENLMVHNGNVYIIDLGMCLRIPYMHQIHDVGSYPYDNNLPHHHRHENERTLILPQSACGKWYYLSPEVCLSEQPFDGPAVDLWAAGVILFIMLTGQPPWEEPKMTDENFKLMSTGYLVQILTERRAGLSADAMDLLQRMFWLDPADRLSLEQVWSHPWMMHEDKFGFSENNGRGTVP